jgi:hypothetical protein
VLSIDLEKGAHMEPLTMREVLPWRQQYAILLR